jgi:heme A synthase
VSIPATGYFFAWVRRQARATAAELILAVAVGTVVAAVAIGFLSCLTAAPVSVRTALKPRGTSPTRQSHTTPRPRRQH